MERQISQTKAIPFIKKSSKPYVPIVDMDSLSGCIGGIRRRIFKEQYRIKLAKKDKSDSKYIAKCQLNIFRLRLIKNELKELLNQL
jgi:hypothetical protein